MARQKVSQKWVKIHFTKIEPKQPGMLKQLFLAHFEPVAARFGPWKIPNFLENGPFQDQKLVKNGSKPVFLNVMLHHWGSNQMGAFQAFFDHLFLDMYAQKRKFYSVFSTVLLMCLSCCLLLV